MVIQGGEIALCPALAVDATTAGKYCAATVSSRVPAEVTQGATQQALWDNYTRIEVIDILKAGPEFKKLAQTKREAQAETYAPLALVSAERA